MNYERNYYDYIKYVKSLGKRELEYSEVHHILPRCLGGSDEPDNLVVLTAREHFLAHYLLTKIYPENFKLIDAFRMMGVINKDEQKRYINSRLYESKKKLFALARGMKVRCIETGEEFNSITEAERKYYYGVRDVIKGRQLTAGGYHWERIDGETIIKQPFQRKKVICANTGEIFDNTDEAAEKLNLVPMSVRMVCNESKKGHLLCGYSLYYYEGEDKEYPIIEPKLSEEEKAIYIPRKIKCVETGEEFDTARAAKEKMYPELVDASRYIRKCCKGELKDYKGLHWEFADDLDIKYEKVVLLDRRKKVICANTKQIFNDAEEAAKEFGIRQELVYISCQEKRATKGLTFYYYEGEKEYPIKEKDLKNCSRKVRCVETGKEYESVIEAARENGIFSTNIITSCNSINRKAGGYHWQYTEDTNTVFVDNIRKSKVRCVETGEEFDSIKEAAKGDVKLAKRISQGCRDGGSVFGFHWEYTENKERISSKRKKVRCVETGKIYKSISEAANWKHSLRSKITACCRGEIEEVNGFHWEYINEEVA